MATVELALSGHGGLGFSLIGLEVAVATRWMAMSGLLTHHIKLG